MKKVFNSLRELDKRAKENFNLKHGILMENAGIGAVEKIKHIIKERTNLDATSKFNDNKKIIVQIICGSGDNGGDGLVIARILADYCKVITVCIKEPKSELCKLQKNRLDLLGIKTQNKIYATCDILVDAFLGTGLKGDLRSEDKKIIEKINKISCFKIAIDIPSGLSSKGLAAPIAINSDLTISMGALKTAFFSDEAKDIVGNIEVVDLGLPRSKYETDSPISFLEESDLKLPIRKKQNTHKKSFGHCGIICGEKSGASLLAATSALNFGAGLITICGKQPKNMKYDFMYSEKILKNEFTAIAIGCGLGKKSILFENATQFQEDTQNYFTPIVLDADSFYYSQLKTILPKLKNAVLTPHPKEFSSLLKICGLGEYTVNEIQKNRFQLLEKFCKAYPHLVVLLKGANTLIGKNEQIYINSLGSSALSKAGSGDVLTGLICALLAQGMTPLDSAINASLAHSIGGNSFKNNYSLTASKLIEKIASL